MSAHLPLAALLRDLAEEGGVTVATSFDDRPAFAAVTTIQLDGSVLVRVDPDLHASPDLWSRHLQAIEERLAPLAATRAWFDRATRIATWIAILTRLAAALAAALGADQPLKQISIVAVPTAPGALLRYFVRPLAARALNHVLGRRLAERGSRGAP